MREGPLVFVAIECNSGPLFSITCAIFQSTPVAIEKGKIGQGATTAQRKAGMGKDRGTGMRLKERRMERRDGISEGGQRNRAGSQDGRGARRFLSGSMRVLAHFVFFAAALLRPRKYVSFVLAGPPGGAGLGPCFYGGGMGVDCQGTKGSRRGEVQSKIWRGRNNVAHPETIFRGAQRVPLALRDSRFHASEPSRVCVATGKFVPQRLPFDFAHHGGQAQDKKPH